MRVISSRSTLLFYRYFFVPLFWLLLIAVFGMILPILKDEQARSLLTAMLLLATVMSVIYIFRLPSLMKPFADEVQYEGNALIVRKSGSETRIPLSGIASMDFRSFGGAKGDMYYLLTLCTPCSFGNEVAFFPINNGTRFLDGTPWRSKSKSVYDDLSQRITQAKAAKVRR
jgi:hypothetical protein